MEPQQEQEKIEPTIVPASVSGPVKEPSAKKQTATLAAAIVTSAAMIAIALIIVLHPGKTGAAPTTPAAATPQATVAVDSKNVNTADEPFIGNVNAPVTIDYWFDYQCPFCQRNEEATMPQIVTNYVNTGKVKIVFKDFAFLGPDSQTLGIYGRAVWAEDPAKFGAWHDAVFAAQGEENSGWATQKEILTITTAVLGASETQKVSQLVATNSPAYQAAMDADKAEAGTFGIQGTPAFIIGTQTITGAEPYAQFQAAINTALAAKN